MDVNILRFAVELGLIILGVIIVDVLFSRWKPTFQGFFCDDESIRYPYNSQTVQFNALLTVIYVSTITLVVGTEYVKFRTSNSTASTRRVKILSIQIQQWILQSYSLLINFAILQLLMLVLDNIVKRLVGSHRPYFIDACKPNIDLSDCSLYKNTLITNYTCSDPNPEYNMSFYSGHSSVSIFALTYSVYYIHTNWKVSTLNNLSWTFKIITQWMFSLVYIFVLVTRYIDHWHHLIDIVFGSIVGTLFGIVGAIHIHKSLETDSTELSESKPLLSDNDND